MTLEKSSVDQSPLTYAVVYQGQYPPPQLSAGVRRVRDICRGLATAGGNVTMIVPRHFGASGVADGDFQVRAVGPEQNAPTYSSRWQFWSAVSETVNDLAADFTLFYDTSLDSLRTMRSLKRSGFRVGFELCDFHSTYQTSPLKKVAYRLSERLLPKESELTVVISNHIAKHVAAVAPKTQISLIPGLCDATTFSRDDSAGNDFRKRFDISPETVVVSYAGSWWKPKGVSGLVEAFAAAQKKTNLPLKLCVAGRCTGSVLEDNVSEIVTQQDLTDHVILPGFLDSEQMVGLLSGSDVVVSPSLNHPFNIAAFPTKVAEYAGTGCAILATAVGDVPLYFEDGINAVLCDPHQRDSMANSIVRLAEDPELRRRIGDAAVATAHQNFDFRKCGIRIDQDVRNLLLQKKCA